MFFFLLFDLCEIREHHGFSIGNARFSGPSGVCSSFLTDQYQRTLFSPLPWVLDSLSKFSNNQKLLAPSPSRDPGRHYTESRKNREFHSSAPVRKAKHSSSMHASITDVIRIEFRSIDLQPDQPPLSYKQVNTILLRAWAWAWRTSSVSIHPA